MATDEPWDELVGPFVPVEGVEARLGIGAHEVTELAARRRLLRVTTADDTQLFPLWQFTESGVLPGLAEVLGLFPEETDGWLVAGWLRTPDPDLEEPPVDALRRGDIEPVLTVAHKAATTLG